MTDQIKRRRYTKRRQQLQQRMVLFGGLLLISACIGVSCYARGKEIKDREISTIEDREDIEVTRQKTINEKAETFEERVARVKEEVQGKGYPAEVIELLNKNSETVDFVENYEVNKDAPYPDTIGESYQEGEIPLLFQWDERWGYAPYGTSLVAVCGCGPTCMAMVAAGLTNDPSITPDKVAAFGTQNSYVDENNNTYWSFMREAGANWNISCYEGLLTEEQAAAELAQGRPIICSVGPGDFTDNGHFIVLTGYDNGNVKVNDPFSRANSEKTWVYADIAGQFLAMWVYYLP